MKNSKFWRSIDRFILLPPLSPYLSSITATSSRTWSSWEARIGFITLLFTTSRCETRGDLFFYYCYDLSCLAPTNQPKSRSVVPAFLYQTRTLTQSTFRRATQCASDLPSLPPRPCFLLSLLPFNRASFSSTLRRAFPRWTTCWSTFTHTPWRRSVR